MRTLYIGRWIKGFKKFYDLGRRFHLSPEAQYRLCVVGWYFKEGKEDKTYTGRHFGIHRNTIASWVSLYAPKDLTKLEPKAPVPIHTYRKKTPEHIVQMIVALKQEKPYLGKEKLEHILLRDFQVQVSSSTIGRIIKAFKLAYLWRTADSSCQFKKTVKKRSRQGKPRPPKGYSPKKPGSWIQIDTVCILFQGQRVYVINAVDLVTRMAYSRAYKSPSSKNAQEFLKALTLIFAGSFSLKLIQSDNGSEFLKYFELECQKQDIHHVFNYPKQPKMNAFIESFNYTIQREFLRKEHAYWALPKLNHALHNYLLEYNFYRPHQSLAYKTPFEVYLVHTNTPPEVHNKIWTHSI
jgi:transposase InsO family protein